MHARARWGRRQLQVLFLGALVSACETSEPEGAKPVGATSAPLTAASGPSAPTGVNPRVSWVLLKEQANLAPARAQRDPAVRGKSVLEALTSTATRSQAPITQLLAQRGVPYRSFWIANALRVEADAATLEELQQRPDVARVLPDRVLELPQPAPGSAPPRVNGLEWGLANIRAPQVWQDFGTRGEGIVIASIDSGAQFDHPALRRQYRGYHPDSYDHNYNWFDPSKVCGTPSLAPCDNLGHGTHTLGTMLGDDGDPGDNQLGVAPHARWIAAKGCENHNCSFGALLASAQWVLAPTDLNGENPRPELRPNIVNNSWAAGSGDPFLQPVVQAWIAAGIFPVFAAGNDGGNGCASAGSPGDYPEVYAAGAYDAALQIAWFSGRGPSRFGGSKPNLAAPGVGVRSSYPGDEYAVLDGTSMAAPHVAGSVALLWSAAPSLMEDVAATRALLDRSAIDMEDLSCGGSPANNNVWGEGRLDVYAAVELAPRSAAGQLEGTLRDAGTGLPLADVAVRVHRDGQRDRVLRTDPRGAFGLRLAVGSYQLTVGAYGYVTQVRTEPVIAGETRSLDLQLAPAPLHAVSGNLRDGGGRPLAGALVSLLQTPLAAAVTDAAGRYRFEAVPEGDYTLQLNAGGCYRLGLEPVQVRAELELDSTLEQVVDGYGYRCAHTAPEYVAASEVLLTHGDDEVVAITLPFPFVYYGVSHETVFAGINGLLTFSGERELGANTPVPSPAPPNAAIYALWDDLFMDAQSSLRTQVVGSAPARRAVIEWRDLLSYQNPGERFSFEAVLYESGEIVLQYAPRDGAGRLGGTATVGIENAAGSDGLQHASDAPMLAPGSALLFATEPGGIVRGTVRDANDGQPIAGASVSALQGTRLLRSAVTNAAGEYVLQVPAGALTLRVESTRYAPWERALPVAVDQLLRADVALVSPQGALTPRSLTWVLPRDQRRSQSLALQNAGGTALSYSLHEAASGQPLDTQLTRAFAAATSRAAPAPGARDTRLLFEDGMSARTSAAVSSSATSPLGSFPATGLALAWGVGVDQAGAVWLSDVGGQRNVQFSPQGAVGASWPAPWAMYYPGDMAFDTQHGLMCQVNVGGDNGIHCWDPASGRLARSIRGDLPWTRIFQRGLAYRPDDDSFYIGGWDEGVIYHVRGLSHAQPGEVLDSCIPADRAISGLAWNGSMPALWVATNSPSDGIYELQPDDCSVLSVVSHPHPGYNGAGLELDALGNLWTVSQADNRAFLLDSGVPSFIDLPWLSLGPSAGTLEPGQSRTIDVQVDTTGLTPGVYLGALALESNSARTPHQRIPVRLVVTDYQQAVDAGARASYVDREGSPWAADRAYTAGSWGYVQSSRTYATTQAISGTADPALYQSVRVDPYAYRFDAVPNGVYQVELRFAQLREQAAASRYFDVVIEGQTLLPALDIAYEVGSYAADDHQFFVNVEDGSLDIRFIPRDGQPVIAALRVTRRPDR